MIEQELTRCLGEFLGQALEDFGLENKSGTLRAPQIINGYLPPKRSSADDDFPFVVIRPDSGTANQDSVSVELTIIIGCYSEKTDGYMNCLNVMTRIRNALLSLEGGILGGRYVLNGDVSWKNTDEQPWPQWNLFVTTNWLMRSPRFMDPQTKHYGALP